jgi:hypothetical protein
MASPILEYDPVSHITAGALGKPGERAFYIQAERGLDRASFRERAGASSERSG